MLFEVFWSLFAGGSSPRCVAFCDGSCSRSQPLAASSCGACVAGAVASCKLVGEPQFLLPSQDPPPPADHTRYSWSSTESKVQGPREQGPLAAELISDSFENSERFV